MSKNRPTPSQSGAGKYSCIVERILQDLEYAVLRGDVAGLAQRAITGVVSDSREVTQGSVYTAIVGANVNGHSFLGEVIAAGCPVILVQHGERWDIPDDWDGLLLEVADTRTASALLAENFYGRPAEQLILVGITGTNGKTTISYLVEELLLLHGCSVGVVGTVSYRYTTPQKKVEYPAPFTTPEPERLQKLLAEMVEDGVRYVVMEVSSHALHQSRIGGLCFDVAAFTNLSHDHLDYHSSMEEYFANKVKLFSTHLKAQGKAVISTPQNSDTNGGWSGRLSSICQDRGVAVVRTGTSEGDDIRLLTTSSTLTETKLEFASGGERWSVVSPLVGHFNVDNLLTTFGIVAALGLDGRDTVSFLGKVTGAPGRLERVILDHEYTHFNPMVFVDYAHTPDALSQVLRTLVSLPHDQLICLVGCGGDRDSSKRAMMGEIAGEFADVVIVTDDNPRTEDPALIRRQIISGLEKSGLESHQPDWLSGRERGATGYVQRGNRSDAIRAAIETASPDDIVVIAGKGHEKYQITAAGKRFFDDVMEAQKSLCRWQVSVIARVTGGEVIRTAGDGVCSGSICTDSRTISDSDIFVPLVGERFDGHDFLDSAVAQGVGCLLVENSRAHLAPENISVIAVDDTLVALGDLAKHRRNLMRKAGSPAVIGITGSCGKTTVKEMTGAILRHRYRENEYNPADAVLQTRGNFNNLIGLPLSLLPMNVHHRAAVLEMGMNEPGEIARLTEIAEPDICCITNVHGVHLEGLGTIEGVAAAKEELFSGAGDQATLIINNNDPHVSAMANRYGQKKVSFAVAAATDCVSADVQAYSVQHAGNTVSFTLKVFSEKCEVVLQTVGLHNVANAACAAAICAAEGVDLAEIAIGLGEFLPADRRMVRERAGNGLNILNDTYNANPASMEAALATIVTMGNGRTVALLGDMLELGEYAENAHRSLGEFVHRQGITFLGAVGQYKNMIAAGATDAGMMAERVRTFSDKDKVVKWIEKLVADGELSSGDWLVVKASRGLQMETIVAGLTGKA